MKRIIAGLPTGEFCLAGQSAERAHTGATLRHDAAVAQPGATLLAAVRL